jgi:hypothetical protein
MTEVIATKSPKAVQCIASEIPADKRVVFSAALTPAREPKQVIRPEIVPRRPRRTATFARGFPLD